VGAWDAEGDEAGVVGDAAAEDGDAEIDRGWGGSGRGGLRGGCGCGRGEGVELGGGGAGLLEGDEGVDGGVPVAGAGVDFVDDGGFGEAGLEHFEDVGVGGGGLGAECWCEEEGDGDAALEGFAGHGGPFSIQEDGVNCCKGSRDWGWWVEICGEKGRAVVQMRSCWQVLRLRSG